MPEHLYLKSCHDGFVCQSICTVILEVGTDNLIDYLHEIRIILMDTEPCSIIGFEHTIDELNGSNLKQELFKQEKSCIGGSIASIEINFNFAIAF